MAGAFPDGRLLTGVEPSDAAAPEGAVFITASGPPAARARRDSAVRRDFPGISSCGRLYTKFFLIVWPFGPAKIAVLAVDNFGLR